MEGYAPGLIPSGYTVSLIFYPEVPAAWAFGLGVIAFLLLVSSCWEGRRVKGLRVLSTLQICAGVSLLPLLYVVFIAVTWPMGSNLPLPSF